MLESINEDAILKIRLEGIKNSQSRARAAFFTILIACAAIIVALWNVYFSWEIQMISELDNSHELKKFSRELVNSETIRNWVKGQWISIPFLGVQISISDVAFFGSLLLYILTFYYFLCVRRENHEIGSLIQDSIQSTNESYNFMTYFGIRANTIFTKINDDLPISKVYGPKKELNKNAIYSNYGYSLLLYLPFLTILFLLLTDIYFVTIYKSPWRSNTNNIFTWLILSNEEKIKLVLYDTFGVFLSISILNMCIRISKFHNSTTKILKEFQSIIFG